MPGVLPKTKSMKSTKVQYVVDAKGKKTGVILAKEHYEALLEDLYDLAVIAERKKESTVPFSKIKQKLKKDGLL